MPAPLSVNIHSTFAHLNCDTFPLRITPALSYTLPRGYAAYVPPRAPPRTTKGLADGRYGRRSDLAGRTAAANMDAGRVEQ